MPELVVAVARNFILPILVIAILIVFSRLVRGPELPDRVIALDLLTTTGMGLIAVYAIATEQPVLLDVAVVMGLITFLGTVAFSFYLSKRAGI